MRAMLVPEPGEGVEAARMVDVVPASPGAGEVAIRVAASALNAADWKIAEWASAAGFIHKKTRPLRLGYDFSGVVETVGDAVTTWRAGDAVFGFLPYASSTASGALAEVVVARAEEIARKPAAVSHVDAAAIATTGCTALQGLVHKAGLAAGQRVLVNGGSGGAGSCAVLVAAQLGAEVVATSSAAKSAFVEGLGADDVVDYRVTAMEQVPGPFDVVYDAACQSSYGRAKNLMTKRGHYVVLLPSLTFVGGKLASLVSGRSAHFVAVKSRPSDLERLGAWLAAGMASPVTEAVAFEQDAVRDALARLHHGQITGKVAVRMS